MVCNNSHWDSEDRMWGKQQQCSVREINFLSLNKNEEVTKQGRNCCILVPQNIPDQAAEQDMKSRALHQRVALQ